MPTKTNITVERFEPGGFAPVDLGIYFEAKNGDLQFDVGLHLIFQKRAAHDAYQEAPLHQQFIDENKDSWKKVRVFDDEEPVREFFERDVTPQRAHVGRWRAEIAEPERARVERLYAEPPGAGVIVV